MPTFRPGGAPNWPSRRASAAPFYAPSAPARPRPYHDRRRYARWLPPLAALGAIHLGSRYYYPYRYYDYYEYYDEEPYCTGMTDNGCMLRWVEIPTEDGDIIAQCVEFCPQD